MLALADLKNCSEKEVIQNLIDYYSGKESSFDYGNITEEDKIEAKEKLKDMSVLIAYESTGSWGCDSSAFYLLKNKVTEELFEIHAGHCSCYGFEGQLDLEPTTIQYLKEKGVSYFCGGYDEDSKENERLVNEYIQNL